MSRRFNLRWIIRAAALLLVLGAAQACASAPDQQAAGVVSEQGEPPTNRLAAIGVQTERHLTVALLTARQMFEGVGDYHADQVTIVACGPAVKGLFKGSGVEADIEQTAEMGDVRVVACGITLEQMERDPSELASGVEAVPNGFIELARLQALGYDAVVL